MQKFIQKYVISRDIQDSVNLDIDGFSLTNEGKVNTSTILKMYSSCYMRLRLINELPTRVIRASGLVNKFYLNTSELLEKEKDEERIKNVLEDNLSSDTSYKINGSLMNNEQYYTSYVICKMLDSAIEYLEKYDNYGGLISHVFKVRYSSPEIQPSERIFELGRRLQRAKEIEPRTYYKYIKYTIYKIDEFLFSDKNEYLHFLNKLIFEKCTQKQGEIIYG